MASMKQQLKVINQLEKYELLAKKVVEVDDLLIAQANGEWEEIQTLARELVSNE